MTASRSGTSATCRTSGASSAGTGDMRGPGQYRQGSFRDALHQRNTARHACAQQYEEHAHACGGQDSAAQEGRH